MQSTNKKEQTSMKKFVVREAETVKTTAPAYSLG